MKKLYEWLFRRLPTELRILLIWVSHLIRRKMEHMIWPRKEDILSTGFFIIKTKPEKASRIP